MINIDFKHQDSIEFSHLLFVRSIYPGQESDKKQMIYCSYWFWMKDCWFFKASFQTPTEDDLELLINSKELKGSYLMSVEALDPDYNPATAPAGTPKMIYSISDSHDVLKIEPISGEVTLNKAAEDIPEEYKTFRIVITVSSSCQWHQFHWQNISGKNPVA